MRINRAEYRDHSPSDAQPATILGLSWSGQHSQSSRAHSPDISLRPLRMPTKRLFVGQSPIGTWTVRVNSNSTLSPFTLKVVLDSVSSLRISKRASV
jgi:hypothetical protein